MGRRLVLSTGVLTSLRLRSSCVFLDGKGSLIASRHLDAYPQEDRLTII